MFQLGNSLREARTRQGLTLADVERVTKIRTKYLRALEEEDYGILPSLAYAKGFLETYAERLGLDGKLYVDEFSSRYLDREDDAPFRARPRRQEQQARRIQRNAVVLALAAIVVLMLLVLGAFTWGGKSGGDAGETGTTVATAGAKSSPGVRVLIVGKLGTPSLVVHNGAGTLLFEGTLGPGEIQTFHERRLSIRVNSLSRISLQIGSNAYPDIGSGHPGPARILVNPSGSYTVAAP